MENQNIRVLVARTQSAVEAGQCDDVRDCDTIREAKDFAKYSLTDAYQLSGEFTEPMRYAKVMRGAECIADYFRKEPKPAKKPTATKRVRELLVDLCAAQEEFFKCVRVMADRTGSVSDSAASDAGITKLRIQEKILVIAWHMTQAARGEKEGNH